MALPLAWQVNNIAGWVSQNVTTIFENVGVVQDAMRSIAVPQQRPDAPGALALDVTEGAIRFEDVHFGYGTQRGVLHGVDLVQSGPASASAWWDSPAPASPPWSTCCSASTGRSAAAS